MKRIKSVIVVLFFAGGLLVTVEADSFTNGSFELPAFGANGTYSFTTNVVGWQASSGAPGIKRGMSKHSSCCDQWFGAIDGAQCLVFASGMWVEQTFDTTPGEDYEVTFSVGRDEVSVYGLSMRVTLRSDLGEELASMGIVSPGGVCTGWLPQSRVLFRAATGSSTVRFLDESPVGAHNTGCAGGPTTAVLGLDNVAVRLAPLSPSVHVSEIKLCWECLTSHVYQVQYTTNLVSNVWVNFGGALSNLSGLNCVRDSVESEPRKFYRVLRQP